jgi:predicted phosphodiesterase
VTTQDRAAEIVAYAEEHGDKKACEVFGLRSSSLNRYRTMVSKPEDVPNKLLKDIGVKFSPKELEAISRGRGLGLVTAPKVDINFDGDRIKFGYITDTHLGGVYYNEAFWEEALEVFDEEKVQFVVHSGDVTDGLSSRPGHIYELTHIGFEAQKQYGIAQFSKWPGKMYMISGNHDDWYIKANNAWIVKDIAEALPDGEFLGFGEGDIHVNNIWIKLFHGEDGSSYATSYRLQKLLESYTGGEKPNILLAGHVHKQGYFFERHVHSVSGGALSTQSRWMRQHRLANHAGFHVIEFVMNDSGVVRFKVEWFPFYC